MFFLGGSTVVKDPIHFKFTYNTLFQWYMCVLLLHPDMGYAQGMNDLLARFLVVTDSEVDAFWMFERYMKDKRIDFMEASMMRKVGKPLTPPLNLLSIPFYCLTLSPFTVCDHYK